MVEVKEHDEDLRSLLVGSRDSVLEDEHDVQNGPRPQEEERHMWDLELLRPAHKFKV